ncbi:MAG: DUF2752 domain-containing protein [Planctomycetota bacterium]
MTRRATVGQRIGAGVLATGILAVLLVAAWLDPANAGHGTHEQLGLPACGFAMAFDRPCVSCGMTTAFSTLVEGRPVAAFLIQPAGTVLALLAATVFWPLVHVAAFGSRLLDDLALLARPKVVWLGVGVLAISWLYKWVTW